MAIEALFVSDSRGEIKYRARNRLARLLGQSLEERQAIAKVLGTSYDRRSQVVHGDQPKPDLASVTDETGEILRAALREALVRGSSLNVENLDLA